MSQKNDAHRLNELDAVRGLACMTVVIAHHLYVLPAICDSSVNHGWFLKAIKFTPLRLFYAGHESLVMFFIMSGFVLALPFYDAVRKPNYLKFVIRRIFRIYPPYVMAVLVGAVAFFMFYKAPLNDLSTVVTKYWWHDGPGWKQVEAHLNLIGFFDARAFNPVVWSLVHEMRIFLIFPLLMLFVLNLDWYLVVPSSFFLLWLSTPFVDMVNPLAISRTLSLLPFFVLGAYLGKHKDAVIGAAKKIHPALQISIVALIMLAYPYRWLFFNNKSLHTVFLDNFIPAIIGSAVIVFSLSGLKYLSFLRSKRFVYLGEISYSVYLYHTVVLLVLLHAFYGKVNLGAILVVSFFAGFPIAALAHRFIEIPSIAVGHMLSNLVSPRRPAPLIVAVPESAPAEKELVGAGKS